MQLNFKQCTSELPKAKRLHLSNTKHDYGSDLEDAKLFKQDIYALIVDLTSAFITTTQQTTTNCYAFVRPWVPNRCHRCGRISLHGSPYILTTTTLRRTHRIHSGRKRNHTRRHPFPSSFIDLYGATSTVASCRRKRIWAWMYKDIKPQTDLEHLANRFSSGAFADDLICLCTSCTKIANLRAQAESYPFTRTGLPSLSQGRRQRWPNSQCRQVRKHKQRKFAKEATQG